MLYSSEGIDREVHENSHAPLNFHIRSLPPYCLSHAHTHTLYLYMRLALPLLGYMRSRDERRWYLRVLFFANSVLPSVLVGSVPL